MKKLGAICILLPLLASVGAIGQAPSSAPAAPVKSTQITCKVEQPVPETDAAKALRTGNYATAESLYKAAAAASSSSGDQAGFADATAGLVRTLIAENKERAGIDAANAALKTYPNNAVLLDALGEAYFRRGETDQAAIAFNASSHADPCYSRVHFDMARFFHLNAEYASEQRQLDAAHRLAPHNRAIANAQAVSTHKETKEEVLARLTERLDSSDLTPDAKASLQRTIDVLQAQTRGTCEIVTPTPSAQIPIVSIASGPTDMYAAGVEVTLNGHKRRFELDTGASGLLLSRSVAQAAGLISEAEQQSGGIGDQGPRKVLLAHVDDITIGNLEFHNCLVRIFDKKDNLDVDGLIGSDVFSSYLVTIDVPGRVIRLAPLPPRPNDSATPAILDTAGADTESQATPQNRYVAPEMADWTRVFRSGHLLIFPTQLNNGPVRLFAMDTGASNEGLVSIAAAKEVTGVGSSDYIVKGVSGKVNDVRSADALTIAFGGVREHLQDVPAVDLSFMGRDAGVEISGLIGFFTLRELVLTIDYRDSLVHVVYDPNHGYHRH